MSRRGQRMSELIKSAISESLLTLKDPRFEMVTITRIELAKDFKRACVFFSVIGDENRQATALRGLEHSRGKLQAEIQDRLHLRYTPILRFEYDPSIAHSIRISQLLKEVLPEEEKDESGEIDSEEIGSADEMES